MKTFYSLEDIENLAAQGVRELVVDEDTVLTDVARDAAARLGLRLVPRGRGASSPAWAAPGPAAAVSGGGKPRGCQHGPLGGHGPLVGQGQLAGSASAPTAARASATGGRLIDDLVGAVKQLANKGSAD